MKPDLSRRDFLKLSGLALGGLVFTPDFPLPPEAGQGKLARVATRQVDLHTLPKDEGRIIGQRFRDQLVHIYAEVIPEDAPAFYNRLWYRVWGGYLHSAHLQVVSIQLNEPLGSVPEAGVLGEITVPYTSAYQLTSKGEWRAWRGSRLYYQSTHWVTGIETGPDGKAWYQVTNELSDYEIYYIPAVHLRPIPPEEIAPLSTEVPPEKKRIEISLSNQTLFAYEYDKEVYRARISSGIPSRQIKEGDYPTATPKGDFNIVSKMPSKHMGSIAGGDEVEAGGGFSLPGVPWTSFFQIPPGYAMHGTYWHNNFGLQMSHGCVNMRNEDAKWLFRWSTPVFDPQIKSREDWERTGNGTRVTIF